MNRAFGNDDGIRVRVSVLGLVMLFLVSILASRLWFLQVLAGDSYAKASDSNHVRLISVPAPRGKILDRNGNVIVGTTKSLTVAINRVDLKQPEVVLPKLGKLLGLTVADIKKKLADKRVSPYTPVTIAENVATGTWLMLRERADEFPGVETGVVPVRLYPGGQVGCDASNPTVTCSVAAHVIGYVGEINSDELSKLRDKGYRLGDEIGRAGIERSYESWLRGRPGLEKLEVDSRGVVLRTIGRQDPQAGDDLKLTLDLPTQRIAEEALSQGILRARARTFSATGERFRAEGGGVVVMDVQTGELLALASYPTFDLQKFAGGIDAQYWQYLNNPDNDNPLLDRAIQSAYPPGSTFKPIMAAAALQSGSAGPGTQFPCTTEFKVGDPAKPQIFHNWQPRNTTLTLEQALIESCDTPFYRLGLTWWEKEQARYVRNQPISQTAADWARKFGLGRDTGIDLAGEIAGRVPDREFKRTQWLKHRTAWCAKARTVTDVAAKAGYQDLCVRGFLWRGGDAINMAIGQGDVQASPLQMAVAYAAVANGGKVVVPHLASQVVDPTTKLVAHSVDPKPAWTVGLAPQWFDYVRTALTEVATRGTAHAPFSSWPFASIPVAAKTGSAEIGGKQPFSWFAAFAPANAPRYVVVSVVEEAGFGSQVSGPIVRRIMDHLFNLPLTPINYGIARSD